MGPSVPIEEAAMLRRFVSAAAVASVLIAGAAVILLNVPGLSRERVFTLVILWLCAPAVWGVWAMLAPRSWTPQRLPVWGAVLGVALGILGAIVMNLPLLLFGQEVSLVLRAIAVPIVAGIYFLLWMVVRRVFVELQSSS
jgi:hypothetical protein